ncbi:tol-pal system protein YbgF [Methylopila turkensis]|uniref:Cell division coordinator CpoB n=1 Tax=Methylopila turkensis TaxID=1437816 RepID=A0A9W6N5Z1_9HYPH|nr:tol-pal system protein YbgF [Methylopila turkensis]GLK78776.1 tol-pal system protein YbgF [Methylopila turkensis]
MHIAPRFPLVRRFALGAALACAPMTAALALDAEAAEERGWIERRVDGLERSLAFFGGGGREERPSSNVQQAQSSMADIAVRLDRLENQMRQLNGRIEELGFQIKRGEETQKRFQSDAEFRFQDLESGKGGAGAAKPGRRGDAGPAVPGAGGGATAGAAGPAQAPSNLGSAPSNLGAPRDSIGGLIDDGPGDDPSGPMRITPPGAAAPDRTATGPTGALPPRGASQGQGGMSVGTGDPRDQFDMGVGFMQRRDYELAEQTFREFLRANPNDPKAAEARYWLGESLYQRRQYTDAADSFYKIYVDAPQSAKAPESMLKLGMSLNGMGKKEEACATIAEAGKKYSRIRSQSDREFKRIAC